MELPKDDETEVTSQEVLLNNLGIMRVGREGDHYAQSSLFSVSWFEMQTSAHVDQIFLFISMKFDLFHILVEKKESNWKKRHGRLWYLGNNRLSHAWIPKAGREFVSPFCLLARMKVGTLCLSGGNIPSPPKLSFFPDCRRRTQTLLVRIRTETLLLLCASPRRKTLREISPLTCISPVKSFSGKWFLGARLAPLVKKGLIFVMGQTQCLS